MIEEMSSVRRMQALTGALEALTQAAKTVEKAMLEFETVVASETGTGVDPYLDLPRRLELRAAGIRQDWQQGCL